ncbi:AraC family transcriptional regulator [Serinicoccus chungangensis]|uniref:AraC family transcriptional regulator n=1 Tax=Serinicoccus chungangensis TaxID=767452 RepID=A0A0W8I4X8_9MICO|nr:AraC family transcriptional regulator [Serinicoccus chungangensis]KUG53282.1 AraC family transcriptional regulator [Serinicoccus chungangensis]
MTPVPTAAARPDRVVAFRPPLAGVEEVLHASWREHAYPAHTHDTWTVLLVDDGAVAYDLDGRAGAAPSRSGLTVLPPHVPHDGRGMGGAGFTKRVLYLSPDQLGPDLVGRAVDAPLLRDATLRAGVDRLHRALVGHDLLEAEARLALARERLADLLRRRTPQPRSPQPLVAVRARERLDADPTDGTTLAAVAADLQVSVPHLVRSFSACYGIPPHRYVLGRRLDHARRLLLDGVPAGQVAVETGFYDQAHLTRHFRTFLGTTPARFQRSWSRAAPDHVRTRPSARPVTTMGA